MIQQNTGFRPDVVLPPGETILEELEARGMSQAELAQRTGRTVQNISKIVSGKSPVSAELSLRLERVLGISASTWSNLETLYRDHLARQQAEAELKSQLDWLDRFPYRDMIKKGLLPQLKKSPELLERLLHFFSIGSPAEWSHTWEQRYAVSFRKSPQGCEYALSAWLRAGQLQVEDMALSPYSPTRLEASLGQIRKLTTTNIKAGIKQLRQWALELGLALVFVPSLPNARVNGATYWLRGTPVVQLSDRYKRDDIFWFTFFHEIGHILLHGKREVFIETGKSESDKEKEADQFAAETLVPPDELRRFAEQANVYSGRAVTDWAMRLEVSPSIALGQLQHRGYIPKSELNGLHSFFSYPEIFE